MSYPKKNSGDPFKVAAREWNYLLESAEEFNSVKDASSADTLLGWPVQFGRCRNDTGVDLKRFSVVGIDPVLILPTSNLAVWQRQVQFKGVAPVIARHTGAWGVTAEPIEDEAIGSAIIAGCTPVRVVVPSGSSFLSSPGSPSPGTGQLTWAAMQIDGEVFADARAGSPYLTVSTSGSARVLWCEDLDRAGGWRWAYVRIGTGTGVTPGGGGSAAFSGVQAVKSTSTSIPSGGAIVTWDGVNYDTDSYWSVTNPTRITIARSGYYLVTGDINWEYQAIGGSSYRFETRLYRGGSSLSMPCIHSYLMNTGYSSSTHNFFFPFIFGPINITSVPTYFEIFLYNESPLGLGICFNSVPSHMSVQKVG